MSQQNFYWNKIQRGARADRILVRVSQKDDKQADSVSASAWQVDASVFEFNPG